MRYGTPVVFVKENEKHYDPDYGERSKSETIRVNKYANLKQMIAERQQTVFGDVRPNRFIVRLQRSYKASYDYVELNGKRCTVDTERCPSDKQSLVVVQNGGN